MATPSVTDIMQVGIYYLNKEHLVNNKFRHINRWDPGVLQKAVDNCHCSEYGDVSFNLFFVFSLPEYLIPWFLGPIDSPNAVFNLLAMTFAGLRRHRPTPLTAKLRSVFLFRPLLIEILTLIKYSSNLDNCLPGNTSS